MKNFCFDTICNITQEPHLLQISVDGFIDKSAVIKQCNVLSKVLSINKIYNFDQLATASSS